MQLEHGDLAELGGEEEAEVSVLGVDADVDDAAADLAVAVPVQWWSKWIVHRKLKYTGFRLYGIRIYGLFGFISVIWSMVNQILVLIFLDIWSFRLYGQLYQDTTVDIISETWCTMFFLIFSDSSSKGSGNTISNARSHLPTDECERERMPSATWQPKAEKRGRKASEPLFKLGYIFTCGSAQC